MKINLPWVANLDEIIKNKYKLKNFHKYFLDHSGNPACDLPKTFSIKFVKEIEMQIDMEKDSMKLISGWINDWYFGWLGSEIRSQEIILSIFIIWCFLDIFSIAEVYLKAAKFNSIGNLFILMFFFSLFLTN